MGSRLKGRFDVFSCKRSAWPCGRGLTFVAVAAHCVNDLFPFCSAGTELKHVVASSSTFSFQSKVSLGIHVCACVALHAFGKPFAFIFLLTFDRATCMQKCRPLSTWRCACGVSSEFPHAAGVQRLAFCYCIGSRLKERFGRRKA